MATRALVEEAFKAWQHSNTTLTAFWQNEDPFASPDRWDRWVELREADDQLRMRLDVLANEFIGVPGWPDLDAQDESFVMHRDAIIVGQPPSRRPELINAYTPQPSHA